MIVCRIKIDDASNGTVLEFEYNDAWHPLTDGPGFSMVARDALQDRSLWGEREGWMPSYAMLGSPGVSEPSTAPLPGAVAINEIMNYGTGVDGDRIELYRPLIIDAKNERAADWYASFGAERLQGQPLRLVIHLSTFAVDLRAAGHF